MDKAVYVFPGQASQYVGMGRELYEKSDRVKDFYRQASDLLGDDLARISFDGPTETLKQTKFTQPAILVHSLALLDIIGKKLPKPLFTAGHSLGEYAALVASGALNFEDAITAVCHRAMLMEKACVENPGTMAAIMAFDTDKLKKICEDTPGIVTLANINSSLQVAVSGEIEAVEKVAARAKEAGAKRAIVLEVGGAFHSPLMASARNGLADCLKKLTIGEARPEVIANVTAQPVSDPATIEKLLVEQITSPVRWLDTMEYFKTQGVTQLIEIGPGRVLTGLAKREMPGVELLNVDKLEDITKIKALVS